MGDRPDDVRAPGPERDSRTGRPAAARRIAMQAQWVDLQITQAMERGEFDNLPGAGKPLQLPAEHDPDWWLKKLIEREQITGVLPDALLLRKDDLELEDRLDELATEDSVRRAVAEFNKRVVEARRQLQGGPPVVTPTRDVDAEVQAWRTRREARRRASATSAHGARTDRPRRRRRWFGG